MARNRDLSGTLRGYRERAGLTQQELARRSYVSMRTIRNLERGKVRSPRVASMVALAEALELTPLERHALGALNGQHPPPDAQVAAPSTCLLGRDNDIVEVRRVLSDRITRLVTLTGTPGVGKTELARAIGHHISPTWSAWWVPVATAPTRTLLLAAIGRATGIPTDSVTSLTARLCPYPGLLVIDSSDGLSENTGLVCEMLAAAPQLSILATAPRALGIHGEHEWPVRPLALPPGTAQGPTEVEPYASVGLLLAHVRARLPTFALDQASAEQAAELCRRLQGNPLAIERAAEHFPAENQ